MPLSIIDSLDRPGKTDTPGGAGTGVVMDAIKATVGGHWERLEDSRFLIDPAIEVETYRWHAPRQKVPCFVDFQSPKEAPHRRFYPVEVLESLKRGEPADDYVERMCRLGIALLPELESVCRQLVTSLPGGDEFYAGKEMPTQEGLEFLLALFESRREGHQRVRRRFDREDDFYATEGTRKMDQFLVPGTEPPRKRGRNRLRGKDVIEHVIDSVSDTPSSPASRRRERMLPLFLAPLRTPLDHVLIEGVFCADESPKPLTLDHISRQIAPSLIDDFDPEGDGLFAGEHLDDFRHFLRRLGKRFFDKRDGFERWLRQESEKGFVRLLPGHKRLSALDREAALEKGRRFFRRVLWTSYEAMGRAFGVTAAHQWVSFFQSDVIAPSRDEQRAFRHYHAPQVFAAGLPLWFFGPNVLRWFLTRFIDKVWGWEDDEQFKTLTTLISKYGMTARDRRDTDSRKKRAKTIGQHRPDLRKYAQETQPTPGSRTNFKRNDEAAWRQDVLDDCFATGPVLLNPPVCEKCGGNLTQVGSPTLTTSWILVLTECAECGAERTYQRFREE